MAAAMPSERELRELRSRLRAYAARSLGPEDAEDAVQTALLRLVEDERPSETPFPRRAFRKLKDVRAEIFRRPQRAFDQAVRPLEEQPDLGRDDQAIALLETADVVESALGSDVMAYAELKVMRCSDGDVAKQLGWTPQRVEAARKKLSRNSSRLAAIVNETLP